MDPISRFVVWICFKFNHDQIQRIIQDLQEILPTVTLKLIDKV